MNNIFKILQQNLFLTIFVAMIIIGGATYFVVQFVSNGNSLNNVSKQVNEQKEKVDETGWIYVDGGAGILVGSDGYGYSYIGESARGTEAYLAEKAVSASYEFISDKTGTYRLEVSLSDDAVHSAGARNASVAVNGVDVLQYINTPENTNGWKWYSLGNISLKKGTNKIVFTKDESTTAAYVMDQFRLIPQP